jgi:dTDP-glucose pyrophosphorylase
MIQRTTQSFLIDKHKTIRQAMRQLNEIGHKELFAIDQDGRLVGALSDGDIRKWILKEGSLEESIDVIYNKNPKKVTKNYDLENVKELMLQLRIESVPVVDRKGIVLAVLTWDDVFAGHVEKHHDALNVPVVIMAGGKGSRLDPFTKILPKPLIPIGEKPIIEIIMDKFSAHAVKNFYISVFHKARMVKSYFDEANAKYNLTYVEETTPLGTVGALSMLKKKIKSDFFVTNCDVIIDCDYAELLAFHRERKHDLTLVVSMRHYVIPYGVCELESGGALKGIKEKPEHDLLVNTGMYIMNPQILNLIPDQTSFNIIDLINAAKAKKLSIGVFPIGSKAWIDVGQWEEYYKSVQELQKGLDKHGVKD